MSTKNFDDWSDEKTDIHFNKERPFFHVREVWFCVMGANIGFEQDGRGENFLRPVVVIRKFNNEVLWALPLTTRTKTGKYYFSFKLDGVNDSVAILSQLRLIDAKRLQYKLGVMSGADFEQLKTKIRQLLV